MSGARDGGGPGTAVTVESELQGELCGDGFALRADVIGAYVNPHWDSDTAAHTLHWCQPWCGSLYCKCKMSVSGEV